jgi:hypothetical protein
MLKRQRPSSPSPIPATYGDDLASSISGPSAFHQGANMNTSFHADPTFRVSRKRPRVSPDTIPGATSGGGLGRHSFLSSPVLSKRRRSPDLMDDDSEDDLESNSGHQISNTYSSYQREGESSHSLHPTITQVKRRRTTAPVLEGSSRGWGHDHPSHTESGPGIPTPTSYPHSSFDPGNPPPGWVLDTQIGEYARENARLYDLHALRPRLPPSEEPAEDQSVGVSVDVDMEEKVVKERYEERNKCVPISFDICLLGYLTTHIRLLGSLFLERQRRLAGA